MMTSSSPKPVTGDFSASSPQVRPRFFTSRLRTFSIRILLVFFVMMIVLPTWGFATYVASQYAVTKKDAIEAAGKANARDVAAAIDFRLKGLEAAMASLALSRQLRSGDIASFYSEAQAVAVTQRVAIALVAPDGRQLLNTNAPMGTALPNSATEVKYVETFATRKIQYSSLFWGNVTNQWLMSLAMPILIDNEARYALVVAAPTVTQWGDILNQLELPGAWAVALVDSANIISARRPNAEAFVGKSVHRDALAVITPAEKGWGTGTSIDDQPVYVYYNRLKDAPWLVLVGVPIAEVDNAVRDAVAPVVFFGLTVFLITVLAAWLIGRSFTTQLVDITRVAMAFRGGQPAIIAVKPSSISELAELKATLDSAIAGRERYEAQLKVLLSDKDMLMQEVHHRVKNSLQLVRGILSLQARSASNSEAKEALGAAAARILTVADVHQHLYQGNSTAEVEIGQYLRDLARDLKRSLLDASPDRHIAVEAPMAMWPSGKVMAIGLIVTELVTNSIKYARGNIQVFLTVDNSGSALLVVEDHGKGFPEQFVLSKRRGLGSKLIISLVRPDEGSVVIDRAVNFGRVVITLSPRWRSESMEGNDD